MSFSKKILILGLILLITNKLLAQYNGGMGTMGDPFQINDINNLSTLSTSPVDWNKHFILTADIDATDTENWNSGKGFSPIGSYDTSFTGSFDGADHIIDGLYIKRGSTSPVGMFGIIKGAFLKNLILENCYIEGVSSVGALVGSVRSPASIVSEIKNVNINNCYVKGDAVVGGLVGSMDGKINNCHLSVVLYGKVSIAGGLAGETNSGDGTGIENCSVSVELIGASNVGGLVGINKSPVFNCNVEIEIEDKPGVYGYFGGLAGTNNSLIEACFVGGEISIQGDGDDYIGGVVGSNTGTIKNCYSSVTIISEENRYVGGLVGGNAHVVANCYSSGEVTGKYAVGGLIGITKDGSQTVNCYSTGIVTGENKTGGFVGENSYFATITNCYSAGEVRSAGWFSGGFVGLNRSTAQTINCFYDIETSLKAYGVGMDHNGQNQKPFSLTTPEFGDQENFTEAGWGFGNSPTSPWQICVAQDGEMRPVFYFQNYSVAFVPTEGGYLTPAEHQDQTVDCNNSSDTVFAVPNEGFLFLQWQSLLGDSISNINPIVVGNVTCDTTLVAVFINPDGEVENKLDYFKVYPNPSSSILNIEISDKLVADNTIFELIGIDGKTVFILKAFSASTQIDIEHLKSGLYFLKIDFDKKVGIEKIVIQ